MKKNILNTIIISIITFGIGVSFLFMCNFINIPLKEKIIVLLISFFPLIVSLNTLFTKIKEKEKYVSIFKNNILILTAALMFYYFMAFIFIGIITINY